MYAITIFDPNSSFNSFALSGFIRFQQEHPNDLVFVQIHLENFKPNKKFACHIHEYGDLTHGCQSACNHFNPYGRKHGSYKLHGPDRHIGDIAIPNGNLESDKNGCVNISFYDDLISLFACDRNIIGRMIVIHENEDDGGKFRHLNTKKGIESGKTGNAGDRKSCAIIGIQSYQ